MFQESEVMDLVKVFELFVVGVIFLGGIICNVLVILGSFVIQLKKTHTLHNGQNGCLRLLIINLATADLLVLLISVPTDVTAQYVSWPFGEFTCKFISPIQDICMSTATLTFAAIAVERYLVANGNGHRSTVNGKRVIFGIWVASWLTMGLPLAMYKKLVRDGNRLLCDVIWPNVYVGRFFLFYIIVLVFGSAITAAISYCSIRRNLAKVHRWCVKDRTNETQDRESLESFVQQTLKVSTMLCVLMTVFVICVLPLPIFGMLVELNVLTDRKINYVIYLTTACMLYGNSLANPVILLLMSRECRSALSGRTLFCRKAVKKAEPVIHTHL